MDHKPWSFVWGGLFNFFISPLIFTSLPTIPIKKNCVKQAGAHFYLNLNFKCVMGGLSFTFGAQNFFLFLSFFLKNKFFSRSRCI